MYHSCPDIYHHWKLKKGHCINIHVSPQTVFSCKSQQAIWPFYWMSYSYDIYYRDYTVYMPGKWQVKKTDLICSVWGWESIHKGRIIYFHFDWSLNFKWKNPYLHKSWFELSGYCQLANPTFENKPQGEMSFSGENVSIYVLSHGTLAQILILKQTFITDIHSSISLVWILEPFVSVVDVYWPILQP